MRRLFVSDLHLEDKRPDISRAFFHLLDEFSGKTDELYILGDLFEIWLGDDALTVTAKALAQRLSTFSEAGAVVYLLHGNRDFLLGEQYASACNAKLIHEPFMLNINNKNTLLMHGDTLCVDDKPYMDFRRMVRNPEWQQFFLSKSIEERAAFGKQARDQSKADTKEKSSEILDVTPSEVTRAMKENGAELFIHGHTHRPARHSLDSGNRERIVLGDWHEKGWYLISDNDHIELKSFVFPQ